MQDGEIVPGACPGAHQGATTATTIASCRAANASKSSVESSSTTPFSEAVAPVHLSARTLNENSGGACESPRGRRAMRRAMRPRGNTHGSPA